jgi:hypothetical protein
MEGSHSPFGFIWQIATQTGWSVYRILWQTPYPTLLLMMSDAPHYVSEEEQKQKNAKISKQKMKKSLEFFQTRLSNK